MNTFTSALTIALIPLLVTEPLRAQLPVSAGQTVLQLRAAVGEGTLASAGSTSAGLTVQVTDETGGAVSDAAVVVRLPDAGATGSFADGSHAAVAYTDESGKAQVSGLRWGLVTGSVAVQIMATKGAAHAGILLEERIGDPQQANAARVVSPQTATSQSHVSDANTSPVPAEATRAEAKQPAVQQREAAVSQPGTPEPSSRLIPPAPATTGSPSVSIVNAPTHEKFSTGSSHTKWIVLALVVAAGAGAGVALMGKKSSTSSPASTGGVTIGGPTVSVGAP